MTLTTTTFGDNPFAPGVTAFAYVPDQLIAGSMQRVTHNVTIMAGLLPRGTIIGRQSNVSLIPVPGTTNTGNGTIGGITQGASPETGPYTLSALSPTSFSVTDPEGVALGNATVGTGFTNAELNFTITAGATAFVAGDSFTLIHFRSDGNFIACVKTATDGSQNPVAVLADAVDASAAPAVVGAYFTGEFNFRAVTFDNSWAIADIGVALQPRNIHLKDSVSALDPT